MGVGVWGRGHSPGVDRLVRDNAGMINVAPKFPAVAPSKRNIHNPFKSMTTSDRLSETLERLAEHRKRAEINQKNPANEGQTRQYLIDPFIRDVLGYDRDDHNDLKESATVGQGGDGRKEVDYAIKRRISGKPEHYILVEAKTVGHVLGENELDQLKDYVAREEFARFGVLTDGIEYKWYRCPPKKTILEDSPFLTHSALEAPSPATCEWLTAVRRNVTDRADLERLAWRLSLENDIREWLLSTFGDPVNPAIINKAVGLKVPMRGHAVVAEAAKSVWSEITGHFPPPPPEFTFEIVDDQLLDLGNGESLTSRRLPRAWRIGEEAWRKTSNASELVVTVLGVLLSCDTRRKNEKRLVRELNLDPRRKKPDLHSRPKKPNYTPIDGFSAVYCDTGINNSAKAELLKRIATRLELDPAVEHPITRGAKVECWLPTGDSYTKAR